MINSSNPNNENNTTNNITKTTTKIKTTTKFILKTSSKDTLKSNNSRKQKDLLFSGISNFSGDCSYLSNFYEVNFIYKGITYRNSEAAFQAQKVLSDDEKMKFSNLKSKQARRLGRSVDLRKDWEEVKIEEMYNIVREKFVQNPKLIEKLLNTGNLQLTEGTRWNDTFWGVDVFTRSGQNWLGRILMRLRDEFRKAVLEQDSEVAENVSPTTGLPFLNRVKSSIDFGTGDFKEFMNDNKQSQPKKRNRKEQNRKEQSDEKQVEKDRGERKQDKKEQKTYKYYSTQRPVSIGTYPRNHKVKDIFNYDNRTYIKSINRNAWGWIEFYDDLTGSEAKDYELLKDEGSINNK